MKPTSLAQKLQQPRRRFHQMHLCWARGPVQPEVIQALGTENNLNKFVSFAIKYVHAIPMLITRVDWEFVNSKVQEIGWWMLRVQLGKQMIFM